jgi:hypothetical protein
LLEEVKKRENIFILNFRKEIEEEVKQDKDNFFLRK